MRVLVFLHLIGAALWLGGLVTLGAVALSGLRVLPPESFRRFIRHAGWAFAGLSAVAWALIAGSGLAMAVALGWPALVVAKAVLGGAVVVAAALHVVTGRRHTSRVAVRVSRGLALAVFVATLVVFWLGVQVAT